MTCETCGFPMVGPSCEACDEEDALRDVCSTCGGIVDAVTGLCFRCQDIEDAQDSALHDYCAICGGLVDDLDGLCNCCDELGY